MDRESYQKLKQDPAKYKQFRDKANEYKRQYMEKLKEDPEKYEAYRAKKREYNREYSRQLKIKDPEKYEAQRKRSNECAKKRQKEQKEKVNKYQRDRRKDAKTGDAIREYHRNYMRNYRKNDVNNINQKEAEYDRFRKMSNQALCAKIEKLEIKVQNLKNKLEQQKAMYIKRINNLKKQIDKLK